jgi:hypothetical protein
MNNGWIKLHRDSIKSSVLINPRYWQIWCWCLMKANHETRKWPFNGRDIEIKAGQFITGRKKATKELRCTVQTYRSAISYLKSTNRITTQSTNQFTVIRIIKWEQYQVNDNKVTTQSTSEPTNQQPTSNQPVTTNKNDKNEKKTAKIKNFNDDDGSRNNYGLEGFIQN